MVDTILDDREHDLIALLPNYSIAHLPVGDIWIGLNADNGLIIERKSVADLEASIIDGRYREQRSRLLAYATEKKAHAVYIIEGSMRRRNERLKKPALMKHLTRLSLRYHVAVFQTESLDETAELCQLFVDQLTTDPTTFEQPAQMTYIETRGNTRQGNTDDPGVFAASVLMCCRGVSATGAQAILTSFGSLSSVWRATEAELASVQVGRQRFGAVKAKRLYDLLHSEASAPSAPSAPAPVE